MFWHKKILLVYQEEYKYLELKKALESFLPNVKFIYASNTEEALNILSLVSNIRFIIIGVQLPGSTGISLIKQVASLSTIPAVICSNYNGNIDKMCTEGSIEKWRFDNVVNSPEVYSDKILKMIETGKFSLTGFNLSLQT